MESGSLIVRLKVIRADTMVPAPRQVQLSTHFCRIRDGGGAPAPPPPQQKFSKAETDWNKLYIIEKGI